MKGKRQAAASERLGPIIQPYLGAKLDALPNVGKRRWCRQDATNYYEL